MSSSPLLPASGEVQRAPRFSLWTVVRLVLPASVIIAFLLFIFTLSLLDAAAQPDVVVFPDFSKYDRFHQTVSRSHFPIHSDDGKRIIAVGDIHGMNASLSALLHELAYDPRSDTLVHLGDIVPKSKKVALDPVLSFMSTHRILGVRGNNDQTVIEWRAWMTWIMTFPGGRHWLEEMDTVWSRIDGDVSTADVNAWLKKSHKKWRAYVPDGWELLGKHYKVARDMSQKHYDYLCSLPLVLYAPAAHTYFVHAGLLPADPTRDLDDPKQPLSHWPTTDDPEDTPILRRLQEIALLNEIPQNQDPWVVMNMRSLLKHGEVTEKGKKGTPWTELWNDVMDSCSGTDDAKQCFPSTVIYGHAAARGLDVKRWSIGLDTGCAYGHRMTAVVLDAHSLSSPKTGTSLRESQIPYGEDGTAQIMGVKCHK